MPENKEIIRVLLVDDSTDAREILCSLLQRYDFIEIAGEAANAKEARKAIFRQRPDLIFLDIKLPESNAFSLLDELQNLPEIDFDVVFVSAYNQYIEKSFAYFPFNFLKKPVDPERLHQIINRYYEKRIEKYSVVLDALKDRQKRALHFRQDEGNVWIDPDEILWCQADGNYSRIFLKDGRIEYVGSQLWQIEDRLSGCLFYRTHKSYLVQLQVIYKVKKNGKLSIKNNLHMHEPLVSKRKINDLVERLNNLNWFSST